MQSLLTLSTLTPPCTAVMSLLAMWTSTPATLAGMADNSHSMIWWMISLDGVTTTPSHSLQSLSITGSVFYLLLLLIGQYLVVMPGRDVQTLNMLNASILTPHHNQEWDIILIKTLLMDSILWWHTKNTPSASNYLEHPLVGSFSSLLSVKSSDQTPLSLSRNVSRKPKNLSSSPIFVSVTR